MNRWIASLVVAAVAAALIVGAAAAAPAGMVTAQTDPENGSGGDSGAESASGVNATGDLSPGERLAGVVGVQGAEIEGEVESRAFEVALRESETNESRAAVVAERLNRTAERLAELEQRQDELRERREAGELSQGAYAARMATTIARIETLSRGLNRSASAAAELPAAVRNETGVDNERLATLRERANELSGPEVAAIARGVAGKDVGGPVAPGRRGPPGNGTARGPPVDAGSPGMGRPGGDSGNRSAGPPGASSGNGSMGTPGAGSGKGPGGEPGNGSVGPPASGSANGTGAVAADGPNRSDPPGSGTATGGGAGNASTGGPTDPGSEPGGESGPSDDASDGNGSSDDASDGGSSSGASDGNGPSGGPDGNSSSGGAGAPPTTVGSPSRLDA
ncbi:hypothetical protein Z052_04640 [Halorubrum sp. C191]|uniref:hypothetical protein n=1 Tax=Halorubrum sp. C191 TaxID=1383842 RepID=UPI000C0761E5|nr:hypothetical protein [Halorubrum sp. C191]PHQ43447.1 hypothetical protein Z052_04640 [Halorubrum sp. C191]